MSKGKKDHVSKRAIQHLLNRAQLRSTSLTLLLVMVIGGVLLVLVRNEISFAQVTGDEITDNAYIRADQIPISSHVAGYVVEVPVADNQRVQKDQVVAIIRDDDYRAKLESAEADLAGARAAIGVLESQASVQREKIEAAKALKTQSVLQRDRQRSLVEDGTMSKRELEAAESDAAQKSADLDAQEQMLKVIEHQIEVAKQMVNTKTAARNLARIDLEYTRISSPVSGQLSSRMALDGQYVSSGTQIGLVVPLPDVWVVANFRESQIARMYPGQTALITVDSVPGVEFKGTVDSISPASGALQALLPPDNATGNFTKIAQRFGVKILLPAGQKGSDRLRPGMSAIVTVTTSEGKPEPAEVP